MLLFPAIDLLAGQVVRLERGQKERAQVYADNPVEVADAFVAAGAEWIHVVDLSAAFGDEAAARAVNDAAIRAICERGVRVDMGGGVRSIARIEELLELGCERVSLGTALVKDPALAREAAQAFGPAVVADIAAKDGQVQVEGWRESGDIAAHELVAELAAMGFSHLVYTDVACDGMQTGIDAATYERIAHTAGFAVVASGGIASLDDIRALSSLGSNVVEAAIVGRALYEGAFSLEQALEVCACSANE